MLFPEDWMSIHSGSVLNEDTTLCGSVQSEDEEEAAGSAELCIPSTGLIHAKSVKTNAYIHTIAILPVTESHAFNELVGKGLHVH